MNYTDKRNEQIVGRLMERLDESTCNFMAVRTIAEALDRKGFKRLDPADRWELRPGGCYYTVKNQTALFAFIRGLGDPAQTGFRIISSHSDSPCFKLKPNAEQEKEGMVKLNVEKYGGGIMYTWFDRPLSMAGRVMVRTADPMNPRTVLVDLRKPLCVIPHLAIHFNREVNEGNKLSVQKDMQPVLGRFSKEQLSIYKERGGIIRSILAEAAGVESSEILDWEICLYPVGKAVLSGLHEEFIQSGRLDDLEMAFASLEALEGMCGCVCPPKTTTVMAVFDNEETGSGTKQGAHSPVLANILRRISGPDQEDWFRALEKTFMVSADNAHGWHPNYDEKHDPTNHPQLGGGPVVKINANCKYMTDSDGAAVFRAICEEAGVGCQHFVNHGDVAGGSTLGNILTGQLDIRGVDMGCAVWAMHSAVETGSVRDYLETVEAFQAFWCR